MTTDPPARHMEFLESWFQQQKSFRATAVACPHPPPDPGSPCRSTTLERAKLWRQQKEQRLSGAWGAGEGQVGTEGFWASDSTLYDFTVATCQRACVKTHRVYNPVNLNANYRLAVITVINQYWRLSDNVSHANTGCSSQEKLGVGEGHRRALWTLHSIFLNPFRCNVRIHLSDHFHPPTVWVETLLFSITVSRPFLHFQDF